MANFMIVDGRIVVGDEMAYHLYSKNKWHSYYYLRHKNYPTYNKSTSQRVDNEIDRYNRFFDAVFQGKARDVERYLSLRRSIDVNFAFPNKEKIKVTALHCAARWGNLEVTKVLLDNGADINWTDKTTKNNSSILRGLPDFAIPSIMTPLKYACCGCEYESVKLLIERGADVNISFEGCEPCLDPNKRDLYYEMPLTVACREERYDIAQLLLQHNAKVDDFDVDRINTPLYWTCRYGNYEMTQILLEKGANIQASCQNSATPLFVAEENHHVEIVQLLKNCLLSREYSWLHHNWNERTIIH